MDFGLTKKQIKIRLLISFILGIICLLIMILLNRDGEMHLVVWILAPFLMTWSVLALLLDFKGYVENAIKPCFMMFLYLFTLRFVSFFQCMFQPFVWLVKQLIYSVKAVVWAFSGERG